jgi:hypothetical protein
MPFRLRESGGFFVCGDEGMRECGEALSRVYIEGDILNVGATYVADDLRA